MPTVNKSISSAFHYCLSLSKNLMFLFYMYMGVLLHVCICTNAPGAHGNQRALEFQMVECCGVGAGNLIWVFCKSKCS